MKIKPGSYDPSNYTVVLENGETLHLGQFPKAPESHPEEDEK